MRHLLLALPLVGCVESRRDEVVELDASTVTRAVVDVARGDVDYRGLGGSLASVRLSSWGRGARAAVASRNELGNTWDALVSGADLLVTATSAFRRAGVDVTIDGPDVLDLDLRAGAGAVLASDTLGSHLLEGDYVETRRLEGEATIRGGFAGVDAELWPYEDAEIVIESADDVTLWLPAFGPYDLRVTGQTADLFEIEDLGFDELVFGDDGTLSAWRFPGTTRVRVTVGGRFTLYESR